MLSSDNRKNVDPIDPSDLTIGDLLVALADHRDKPLVFRYGGRPVKPGYHVTEVKAGQFAALDCEANPESWSEIFVQLWDVDEGGPVHMPAGKFAAIIRKVSDHVALDQAAKLTFEVSDGVRPMELHRAAQPSVVGGAIEVELSPRPASCKPRDRWLKEQAAAGKPCCGGSRCCRPAASAARRRASEPDHAIVLQQIEAHENDSDQRHPNGCPAHA